MAAGVELLSVARRSLAVACCVGSVWAWARDAAACLRPAPLEFSIDPAERAFDLEPPSAPLHVQGVASRSSGTFCDGGWCTSLGCGGGSSVQLSFEPAQDHRNSVLGYRLQLVSGSVPAELQEPLRKITAGKSALSIELPFDEIVALDATFALVAIDTAGNESAPSEPFHVAFDGCTRVVDHSGCAEDMPGVTCNGGLCNGPNDAADDPTEGCSLKAPGSAPVRHVPLALGLCLGVGALVALRRRR